MWASSILWYILVAVGCCLPACKSGDAEFYSLVNKMQNDVLAFGREIEHYYSTLRCDPRTWIACNGTNYHETLSEFPGQQCYTTGDLKINVCYGESSSSSSSCGTLRDYTTSSVRIPKELVTSNNTDYYPTNPRAVEMICYSAYMDRYLQAKKFSDQQLWDFYGMSSPQMFFGHSSGAFRIYPGTTSKNGGEYDPRKRPWYIAASSGPKNVILILDTSQSKEGQVEKLKAAATQTISSLTGADKIAIVAYSVDGNRIGSRCSDCRFLVDANEANKKALMQEINDLEAFGYKETYDAFDEAFQILDEAAVECKTAILFVTDGAVSADPTSSNSTTNTTQREDEVILLVSDKVQQFSNNNHNVTVFTYTIGDAMEAFPKKLACQTGGIWSRIVDGNDISDTLTSYYELFTIGHGTGLMENFTTWVDIYQFAEGDVLGTTVSTPVYDRIRNLFLGVVGADLFFDALNRTLPNGDAQTKLNTIIRNSWRNCPAWNPTACELESFRRRGAAGEEALCTNACTDFNNIEEEDCPGTTTITIDDNNNNNNNLLFLPNILWADTSYRSIVPDFSKRVCCKPGETKPSDQCPVMSDAGSDTTTRVELPEEVNDSDRLVVVVGLSVGVAISGAFLVILVAWMAWIRFQRIHSFLPTTETPRTQLPDPIRPPGHASATVAPTRLPDPISLPPERPVAVPVR